MLQGPSLPNGQSMQLGMPTRLRRKNFALFKWLKIIERGPWDFAVSRDFLRARLMGLGAGELLRAFLMRLLPRALLLCTPEPVPFSGMWPSVSQKALSLSQ